MFQYLILGFDVGLNLPNNQQSGVLEPLGKLINWWTKSWQTECFRYSRDAWVLISVISVNFFCEDLLCVVTECRYQPESWRCLGNGSRSSQVGHHDLGNRCLGNRFRSSGVGHQDLGNRYFGNRSCKSRVGQRDLGNSPAHPSQSPGPWQPFPLIPSRSPGPWQPLPWQPFPLIRIRSPGPHGVWNVNSSSQ